MYIDAIQLFAKYEKELYTIIQKMGIYNQEIGMEFEIENWAMLNMRWRKLQIMEGLELPNQK